MCVHEHVWLSPYNSGCGSDIITTVAFALLHSVGSMLSTKWRALCYGFQ